jgi:peptide-methionine (S)-S-oxide reductase
MIRIFTILLVMMMTTPVYASTKTAVFAGGCFWCMESEYKGIEGVSDVVSGFSGGSADTATYEQVSKGGTGHREVVQITYDPEKVRYETLLDIFWSNVDPFDEEGQFCDKGFQYTAAIFVNDEAEREKAKQSLAKVEKKHGRKVATAIVDAEPFYPAEEYHQDYFRKNPIRYKLYRGGCGRDKRLEELNRE